MLASIKTVQVLLLAIFILMAGAGSITTIVSFRLEATGHPAIVVGLVATGYFGGLIVGALRVIPVIRQVGHIRTFSAVVSVLSVSTLAYSLAQDVIFWTLLRFVDGICVASVFVCLESWLNERADPATRGTVLAAYMIALYAGQAVGQMLLNVGGTTSLPFVIASILVSLAVLPIALTRTRGPEQDKEEASFSVQALYTASPLGFVGVAVTGLMIGAFYALGVVYARRVGLPASSAALFMSAAIAGGVALQWPLGWLSDRFDRRRVIVGVIAGTLLTAIAFVLIGTAGGTGLLLMLGSIFGGLVFALYPLCAAHTNDHLAAHERVGASGRLILVYSTGAAIGPLGGSGAVQILGASGLFQWIGLCALIALLFAFWRQIRRAPVPDERQQPYRALPRTTPMAARLEEDTADRKTHPVVP